jgi:hypothetical protein
MRRLLRWYGASPLHLLAFLGSFALAGYAAVRLVPSRPLGIAAWFLGAVIGHDLVLMPLYSLADSSAVAAIRHRVPQLPAIAWINYLRVPAALSGLLFLVWIPLILRLRTRYQASTTMSPAPFLWHWLAVTGALFLLSAAALALRIRTLPRPAAPPEPPAAPAREPAPPELSAAPEPSAPPEPPAREPAPPAAPAREPAPPESPAREPAPPERPGPLALPEPPASPAPPSPPPPQPAVGAGHPGHATDPDPHPPAHYPGTTSADSPGPIPADDADHGDHAP